MTTISQRTEFTTEPAHPLTDFIETVLSWYIGLMSDRSTVATKYVVVLRGCWEIAKLKILDKCIFNKQNWKMTAILLHNWYTDNVHVVH